MVDWGDVPTWVTAGVAFLALIGAALAYRTQSEQLRLQRIQFADETRVRERLQADQVDVYSQTVDHEALLLLPDALGDADTMVVVVNNSDHPIREVACMISSATLRDLSPVG